MSSATSLSKTEQDIVDRANKHARKTKKRFAKTYTNKEHYLPEDDPVSVFMAGSPGAGKTEVSKALVAEFNKPVLRLDPDEFRCHFEDYNGDNSYLFQGAVSILLERCIDLVYSQKQSFILDGTLSNLNVAKKNIDRSIAKGRLVQILYVYQSPDHAWDFVQAREKVEGRRILIRDFIDQYFNARNTVNEIKKSYGKKVRVDLLLQNYDNSIKDYKANVDTIDNHVPEKYTAEALEALLIKG